MKLRYTPRAARDIAEIADHIRTENPAASERVCASIIESLQLVTEFPLIGRAQSVTGVRKLITRRYRYVVYYCIDSDMDERPRLNDLMRGKIMNFSVDTLINLATQAGLAVRIDIDKAA